MTTTLLLIRHGETDDIDRNIFSGRRPGVPLNQKGRVQAAALAQSLTSAPISYIYASPVERARETAGYLADLLHLEVILSNGIIETDIGDWTGLTVEQVQDSETWQTLLHRPDQMRFPGGESFAEIQQRAVDEFSAIAARHLDQMVACFSHGDIIRLAFVHFLGMPLSAMQRLRMDTCSVSVLRFSSNHRVRVTRINQVVGDLIG